MPNILATDTAASFDRLLEAQVDVTNPEHVEVLVDRKRSVVWVNVNGVCVLRACQITNLVVDERG